MANVFEAFAAIVVLLRFCCCTTTRCKVVRLQGVKLYDYKVCCCTTIRCCHYSQQMCRLQSADLLTRLSRAAEPSDKLREAVFSYPRRSIRCPEKLSPLTRDAISVSLFNHILLLINHILWLVKAVRKSTYPQCSCGDIPKHRSNHAKGGALLRALSLMPCRMLSETDSVARSETEICKGQRHCPMVVIIVRCRLSRREMCFKRAECVFFKHIPHV